MSHSSELLKGTLKTIVLKLLADNTRLYGYEITQKVKEITSEKILLTEGSLYPVLHSLEADDLVTVEVEYIGKRIRKHYRLSLKGKKMAAQKVTEVASFIESLSALLDLKIKLA
jgi:PadR family transcriptional regulator, regulatory protein PadR